MIVAVLHINRKVYTCSTALGGARSSFEERFTLWDRPSLHLTSVIQLQEEGFKV